MSLPDSAPHITQIRGATPTLATYSALRAYSGAATLVYVAGRTDDQDGAAGVFAVDESDTTSADNGGTILIDALDRRWKRQFDGAIYTSWFGTGSTATQAAINAAYGNVAEVIINGWQVWDTPVELKNGIKLRGRGVDLIGGGTKVLYTGTTDALVIKNLVNGSTSANIDIEGIWFQASSLANNNGCIFDTASSVLKIRKCRFNAKIGIIFDQTEMADIVDCSFAVGDGAENCAIWLVNGNDKNPTALTYYTNRISVKYCEFNGGAGSCAIRDDGGISHSFEDNNYNACGSHIIATAVNGLRIKGGEYEVNSDPAIILGMVKKNGGAGSKITVVDIDDVYYYNDNTQPFIASVANAVGHLNIVNSFFHCPATVFSGLNVACDSVHAEGNRQLGTGDSDVVINNYYDQVPATTNWIATVTSPTIGNGSLAAVKSRKGRDITYRLLLNFGSTTSQGAGDWLFELPDDADTISAALSVGSARAAIPSASGYVLASYLTVDGQYMKIATNLPDLSAGSGIPSAWIAGSQLVAQITYQSSTKIN